MAVTSVNYLQSSCSEADDGTITYDAGWQVITNAVTDGPPVVRLAPGLPKRGDGFTDGTTTDNYAVCNGREIRLADMQETRKVWAVTIRYSTKGNGQKPDDNNQNPADPIDWSWKLRGDTWQTREAPEKDIDDRALVNVVEEPFLPPPEREKQYPLLVFTKNHPTLNLQVWSEAQGKVNDAALWGLPARTIKLRKWTFDERWLGGGQMYFANTLEVEINFGGYYFQPPNLGHREKVGVDLNGKAKYEIIRDEMWYPLTHPVPLDQFGSRLPDGSPALFFDQGVLPLKFFKLEYEYDLSTVLPAVLPGNFT